MTEAVRIQPVDDNATLHIIWGSWLEADTILKATRTLRKMLRQRPDIRFILFDMSGTQHYSLHDMVRCMVTLYETASDYSWLLVGDGQQVRPCQAILKSISDDTPVYCFPVLDAALCHIHEHSAPTV